MFKVKQSFFMGNTNDTFIIKTNPLHCNTQIEYSISNNSKVSISVVDSFGNEVETLVDNKQKAGEYSLNWSFQHKPLHCYPCGSYYIRFERNKMAIDYPISGIDDDW